MASLGLGILPAIASATCTGEDPSGCFPMPSFADFISASGDWITGMFAMIKTPLLWGIGWMVIFGVIAFTVFLVANAVKTLTGH